MKIVQNSQIHHASNQKIIQSELQLQLICKIVGTLLLSEEGVKSSFALFQFLGRNVFVNSS